MTDARVIAFADDPVGLTRPWHVSRGFARDKTPGTRCQSFCEPSSSARLSVIAPSSCSYG